jgi:MFS family permease
MNFTVLVPYYATHNLGQDAAGYGFLMTCMGIGSFTGALLMAAGSKTGPRIKLLLGGAAGMAALLAVMGLENSYLMVCVTLLAIGFCAITFTTMVNTTIQLNSADHMRGRVMSVYSLVFGGVIPIGSIYAGKLAEVAGAQQSMIISGVIGLVAAGFAAVMLFGRRRKENAEGKPGEDDES